jgi:hypothetical protein
MLLISHYLQKSHLLLYPLLGMPINTKFKPTNTYLEYGGEDNSCKLICLYEPEKLDKDYYLFRNEVLLHNPYFSEMSILIGRNIFKFDLKPDFEKDYKHFLNGKYSKFSESTKQIIAKYYSDNEISKIVIDSHLNPEEYHEAYAEFLEASVELIQNNFETLTPPDLIKETLV